MRLARDNDYAAIVSDSGTTSDTLTFVDADFDTFTFSWIGAGGTNLRVREDYNYVPTYSIRQHKIRSPVDGFTLRTLQERRYTTRR
jgi:hypothetical protein